MKLKCCFATLCIAWHVQCSLQQIQDQRQMADLDRTSYNNWFHPNNQFTWHDPLERRKEKVVLMIIDFVYTGN